MTALLEESRREGWGPPQRQLDDDGLTEDDWDVVCQFFWLPHSHGPMVERLLEDFRWCLLNMIIDNQAIRTSKVVKLKMFSVHPLSYLRVRASHASFYLKFSIES